MKEGERIRRKKDCETLEFNSFTILTPLPHQTEKLRASNKSKALLQILSREYIANLVNKDEINIALSGYITNNRANPCIEIKNKTKREKPELNDEEEEADTRTVSHVNDAVNNGFKKNVIVSNDADVVVYVLNYTCYFQNMSVEEIWIQYGASDKTRFIPVHRMCFTLGEIECKGVLKSHVLSGCYVTSKVVLKNLPETFLQEFGEHHDSDIQD